MAQTLEQLKQENARLEAAAEANESDSHTEMVEDEYVEVNEEGQAVEVEAATTEQDDSDDSSEDVEAETETELWMQSEEQTSQTEQETFTSSDMAKLRKKMKAKNEEKDSEIEELKAQIAQLQNSQAKPQEVVAATARPKLEDFGYDEDKYNEAYEKYMLDKLANQNNQSAQQSQQQQAIEAAQKLQAKHLDSHYNQVEDLIANKTITADAYQSAEMVVRQSIEKIAPGAGDSVTDSIIAQLDALGEGSAKVMFHLGRNQVNRERLANALASDPSGLQAMGILGELKAKLTSAPAKKISSAPKPSASVRGDESAGSNEGKLKRKYQQAHKDGDSQKAFNIKLEAKAAGFNTRTWS